MKKTFLFTYSKNILVRFVNIKNCLNPKIRKINVRPRSSSSIEILLPHYSKSAYENATRSSSTSPLASYKEVPPPPPGILGPCQSAIGQFFPLSLVTVQEVSVKVISPQFSPHFLKWQVVSHPTEYVCSAPKRVDYQ